MASNKSKKYNKEKNDVEKVKLIRSLVNIGREDKALEYFNTYFGERTTNTFALIEYVRILIRNQDYKKAIDVGNNILSNYQIKDNDKAYIYYFLGDAYFSLGDFENAYEAFTNSYEINSNNKVRSLFRIYGILVRFDKIDEANKTLDKVLNAPYEGKNIDVINKARVIKANTYLNFNTKIALYKADELIKSVDKKVLINDFEKGFYYEYVVSNARLQFYFYKNYPEAEKNIMKSFEIYDSENINKENVSIKNEYFYSHILLGIIKSSQGLYDEGNKIFESLLKQNDIRDSEVIEVTTHIAENYLIQFKANEALEILSDLKDKYPDNQVVNDKYIKTVIQKEIINKDYEKAKSLIFENLNNVSCKEELYFKLINIYLHEGSYDLAKEALQMFDFLQSKYGNKHSNVLRAKKLHSFFKAFEGKIDNYLSKQIANYSRDEAIEHIKKHKDSSNKNEVINTDIDIEYLYDYLQERITEENYIDTNIMDKYFIRVDNVGVNSGEVMNYVIVVTVPNTNHIITVYPSNRFIFDDIELDYEVEEEDCDKPKVKRLSQVEKFNKRYGL